MRKRWLDRQEAMMAMAQGCSGLGHQPIGLVAWLPSSHEQAFGLDREADTLRCPPPDTLLSRVGSWLVRLGRRMGGSD
jgi:hypothetical protein